MARALATHNLAPADATFRVLQSRLDLDGRQRVVRAEATLLLSHPRPIGDRSPDELRGLVNPDGEHPLMVRIPGTEHSERAFFLDIFAVTWDRWLRRIDDTLPPLIDPLCPRVGVEHAAAAAFARDVGKRLPTANEYRAAFGGERFPWGERNDPRLGRASPPRFDDLPEVGLHPPNPHGVYDIGTWLWHWTADGSLAGGLEDGAPSWSAPPSDDRRPRAFRLVQDG